MENVTKNKKKMVLVVVNALIVLLAGFTIIITTGFLQMTTWLRVLLVVIGFVVLFGGILVTCELDRNVGSYKCKHCHKLFVPSLPAYVWGMHTLTLRHLKCPECGKRSWCKRRI